jgi:phytoene/squalene synthetase
VTPDPDIAACAEIVRRGDPPRFRATMAAPVRLRETLFPLYAFNVEVARAPWVTQEPMIALMRLQWWRDALGEIAEGGRVRRHEVVTPLARVLDGAAARELDAAVAAREWDVEREVPADRAALHGYLDATAGALLWVAARLAGAEDGRLRAAGLAQGCANWIAALPALAAKGRAPLPPGDPEAELRALAEHGLAALEEGRGARVPRGARPVLLALTDVEPVLRRAARAPGAALEVAWEPGLGSRLRLALAAARA